VGRYEHIPVAVGRQEPQGIEADRDDALVKGDALAFLPVVDLDDLGSTGSRRMTWPATVRTA
jgi:hypothetical protein